MPVILLYVSDASGENWRIVNVPPPWSSSTGATGGGTTLYFDAVTAATSTSSTVWPMATSAFDTSPFYYQDQLAQQAARQLAAYQYLAASPGAINNVSRQRSACRRPQARA